MNIRVGRTSRGSTPPDIFFQIIKAQRSHGDVAALEILSKKRNRDIAITLVRTQYCPKKILMITTVPPENSLCFSLFMI
jgi:precorrin-3B methylase